jgi:hypothetical protein
MEGSPFPDPSTPVRHCRQNSYGISRHPGLPRARFSSIRVGLCDMIRRTPSASQLSERRKVLPTMPRLFALFFLILAATVLLHIGSNRAAATPSLSAVALPSSPPSPAPFGVCHCEATPSYSGSGTCDCGWTISNIHATEGTCVVIACTPASTCVLTADITWTQSPPTIPPATCDGKTTTVSISTGCGTVGTGGSRCVGGSASVTVTLTCADCTQG